MKSTAGKLISVKFTHSNTADNPTLTIQTSTGTQLVAAAPLMQYDSTNTGRYIANSWRDGAIVNFIFDGTNWVEVSGIDSGEVLATKTYTGVIGTANDLANASFYYGELKPKDYNAVWRIKFKVYAEAAGRVDARGYYDVLITGTQNKIISYATFNTISNTSYRPIYINSVMVATSAGITAGYYHLLGWRLYSAWNPATAANARTITVDILELDNCDFTFWDTIQKPGNVPGAGDTNYVGVTGIDAYSNGLIETGDNDTYHALQYTNARFTNNSTLYLGGYNILGFVGDNIVAPLSVSSSGYTGTTTSISETRVYSSQGFDWSKGLFYFTGSTAIATNGIVTNCRVTQSGVDLRYSDNCVASTAATTTTLGMVDGPVYIRGIIKEDGLFYIMPLSVTYDSKTYQRCWTQTIPNSVETVTVSDKTYQYVYWHVGFGYYNSTYAKNYYQIVLAVENKMYWYNAATSSFEEYRIIPKEKVINVTGSNITPTSAASGTFTPSMDFLTMKSHIENGDVLLMYLNLSGYYFGTEISAKAYSVDVVDAPNMMGIQFESIDLGAIASHMRLNISVGTDDGGETTTGNFSLSDAYLTGISSSDVTTALGYAPVNPSSLATVATSGDYDDLSDKPDLSNYMVKGVDYVTAGKKSGTTLGTKATAEGNDTTASGNYSHAEGNQTTASGIASHTEGFGTIASSSNSHAEGNNSKASNSYAHAEGNGSTASGESSHAEGDTTTASGRRSHAENYSTTASGPASHAEGDTTQASGWNTHAEGSHTSATRKSQHTFGEYNIAETGSISSRGTYVEIVGNGTAENARSNARTLD